MGSSLKWSSKKPNQPGWWWCITPYHKYPYPSEVKYVEGVLFQEDNETGELYEVDNLIDGCLWAGPFSPPPYHELLDKIISATDEEILSMAEQEFDDVEAEIERIRKVIDKAAKANA